MLNLVQLIGNLGADPELKYTPSGTAVANVNLATSEKWTDREGQRQEHTEWHRLVLWKRTAEIAGEYLRKGSKVYVQGKLQTRSWEDQSGQKRYATEIVVRDLKMLDGKQQGGGQGGSQSGGQSSGGQSSGGGGQDYGPPTGGDGGGQEYDDDLPF